LAKFLAPRGKIKVKSVEVTLPDSVICDNSHGQPQTGALLKFGQAILQSILMT